MGLADSIVARLWEDLPFRPNDEQQRAIEHTNGPLLITAGPGTGKTQVLLWRTVHLIVDHQVPPEAILLGTFTEKAARQLEQGLADYLAKATQLTHRSYDCSRMLIGTLHSICRRILTDRRFVHTEQCQNRGRLQDELDQYFWVLDSWDALLREGGFQNNGNREINTYVSNSGLNSRHAAVGTAISFFNRFTEECLDPRRAESGATDPTLRKLLHMYHAYCDRSRQEGVIDLSRLQQEALEHCRRWSGSSQVLSHVMIDEYQDTNHVQEALLFHLARGQKNLCVVGDDDQALYRFRGATVENLVEFEQRCREQLGRKPCKIHLGTNYRSQRAIVAFYSDFIQCSDVDWSRDDGTPGSYRIEGKTIRAYKRDDTPAVVASGPAQPERVCAQVAGFVRRLLDEGKVSDPNQIAFLYPSLKSTHVQRMIDELKSQGLDVYAPRARRFLDVQEALDVFGVFLVLFEKLVQNPGMREFSDWMERAHDSGKAIVDKDRTLRKFIAERQRALARATTLDWGVLDLFYELTGYAHFRRMFDQACKGDEGPVYNLALISRYLARYQERRGPVLSARLVNDFFNSFLYALWRRGESEYEDSENPFPKGRIPFLTVHQAKGLEFPVVVLSNLRKDERLPAVEEKIRPLLDGRQREPLNRMATFDVARLFYVALSRPKNLLVLCAYRGQGHRCNRAFATLLRNVPRIEDLDLDRIPSATQSADNTWPPVYSYTGDYLAYRTCPRRYQFYRRYTFAPTRDQTVGFGRLVHRTIEDLHRWLRVQTEAGRSVS